MVRDGDQAAAFGVSTCSAFQEGDQPLPLDGWYRDLPDLWKSAREAGAVFAATNGNG